MKSGQWIQRVIVVAAILYNASLPAFCHETGLSTVDLRFVTNGLDAELVFAKSDLVELLVHSGVLLPLTNTQEGSEQKALNSSLEQLKNLGIQALGLEFDGRELVGNAPRFALDDKENFHLELSFLGDRPVKLMVKAKLLPYLPINHLQFVSIHDLDGAALGNKMLKTGDDSFQLLMPPGGSHAIQPRVSTFSGFVRLGVEHIWTGYDHLLFLWALLLVCRDFKSAIQVVTCFTLAHSFTLAFATLNLVWVSSRVVEPAIAASIIYVGVENFLRPEGPKGRWLITFLFGLVHGLGFSTVLRDMGVSSSTTGITVPLVGFNLGVEAGQLVVACLLLPLIWKLRNWEPFLKRGIPACSMVVALAGCYWFTQRVFFA
jgi:hypothetical protein